MITGLDNPEIIAYSSQFVDDNNEGQFSVDGEETSFPDYSKDSWIDTAIDKSGDEVVMKPDFNQTHWYNFHQASKNHFARAMSLIQTLL